MVSILDSIKQLLGIESSDTNFDKEITIFTNGALMVLNQLGVGPLTGYSITSKDNVWDEFLLGRTDLDLVKTDVYLRVRLAFDPPQNSFLVNALEKQIEEYDWRITVNTTPVPVVDPEVI